MVFLQAIRVQITNNLCSTVVNDLFVYRKRIYYFVGLKLLWSFGLIVYDDNGYCASSMETYIYTDL